MAEIKQRGLAEARRVAANAALALANNDYGFLSELLMPLVQADSGLALAFMIDGEGGLIAKASQDGFAVDSKMVEEEQRATALSVDVHEVRQGDRRILQVSVPIELKGRVWGRAILGYSLARLTAQLAALEEWRYAEVRKSIAATIISAVLLAIWGFWPPSCRA